MNRLIVPTILLACLTGGCIKSSPLVEGELDRYWTLSQDVTLKAVRSQPAFGEAKLPSRWVVRQRPSIVWSTVSIIRAYDKMKTGADEIDFTVAPAHAEALIEMIRDVRGVLENLAALAESGASSDKALWAKTMANTLAQVESIARMVSLEEDQPGTQGDPKGLAAGPLVEMLAIYLNEQADGSLLEDLDVDDIERLREVLTQIVLRLGFDLAGKQLPADMRASVTGMMKQTERMDALESSLVEFLGTSAEAAPPAPREGQMAGALRVISRWGPKAFKMLEAFLRQWDRIEAVEMEYLELDGQPILSAVVRVLPGKKVIVSDVMAFQPAMVFRGASRMTVLPEDPQTGQTIVAFEPVGDGAIELRYEGFPYSLVRLFGFPLASGPLREIRVFTSLTAQGKSVVNVAILSEDSSDKSDPRRLLVYQDVRDTRIDRQAFAVDKVELSARQVFNYMNSTRRWTYQRVKPAAASE